MSTSKERTNKKWTSNGNYRDNYDSIFGKKEVKTDEGPQEEAEAGSEAPATKKDDKRTS